MASRVHGLRFPVAALAAVYFAFVPVSAASAAPAAAPPHAAHQGHHSHQGRLSAAWKHAFHPQGATPGVLALRAAPLTAAPPDAGPRNAQNNGAPQGPQQCTLPGAPGGVSAVAGANQATITWTAANGNGDTITAYVVREATGPDAGASIATSGTALTATLTGLAGGTAATFAAVAETICGTGPAGTSAAVTPTGSATTYETTVLASAPAAFYRLDEPVGATVMADSATNAADGTPAADGAYSGQETLGTQAALASDPATSTGYTSCCSGLGTGSPALPMFDDARSVEAWVNTTDSTTNQAVAGWGSPTTDEAFIVSISAQSINVDGESDYLSFPTARPLDTGLWHLITVTFDGTTVTAYLDGLPVGSAPFAGTVNTLDPSGIELAGFSGYNFFQGDMADVAVYPTVLSAATVSAHFGGSGYAVPTTPPAVHAFFGGPNNADVSWGHATASGTAVTGYLVTALNGTTHADAISVSPDATAARVTGLAPGSYTFQVVALDAYGPGPAGKSAAFTVTGASTTYAATVLASSPDVFYKLADAEPAAMADSSAGAATGYYTANATLGVTGPIVGDSAISDPSTGLVGDGNPTLPLANQPRTVEGWINTTFVNEQFLAGYGLQSAGEGFTVAVEPNGVIVSGVNDDLTFTAPAPLDDGSWHFITATTNGVSATVFVDGVSLGTQNFPTGLNTIAAPQGLVVGGGVQGCCGSVFGDLADVAVFPTALSAATVTAQFAASGLGRPPAPTTPSATAGANQATVSWTAPATANPAITGYLITAKNGSASVNSVSVNATATNAVVTGLAGGTAYTFTVQAINEYGAGAAATTASVTPTGATSTYASTTLADGPSVFYRLADADPSSMADSSGHGATGSYSATATQLTAPGPLPHDAAPSADGNGSGPMASGHPSLPLHNSARTLEGWFNTTSIGTDWLAGYGIESPAQGFGVAIQPQDVIVSGVSDDLTFTSPVMLDDGNWHFAVITTTGSSATVYVDGVNLGTQNFGLTLDTLAAPQGMEIGAGVQACCGVFTGSLADIAVLPAALTATQVTAQFTASGLGRPPAPATPSATAGVNQATVSWTPPATSDPKITGYLISASTGTELSVPSTATSTTLTGLAGGTAETFTIRAINLYGTGTAATTAAVTPTGPSSTYASTTLANAPSAFYRLADGDSGAMTDSSGHGATGFYGVNATLGQTNPLPNDAATSAAGNGNGLVAAAHPALPTHSGSRTLEGWVNTISTQTQWLAGYGTESATEGFALGVQPDDVLVSGVNDDLTFTAPSPLNDGGWHFIAVTTNGSSATVYVDGTSIGTQTFAVTLDTLPSVQGLSIGTDAQGCCGAVTGDLADVAVFPAQLTAAQISAQFAASGLGRPAAPTAPSATAGANQATVSWTAPVTSSPGVTGYLITASTGTALSVPSTATSTTVTGLPGGTAETFTIAAINEYGAGPAATTAAVTPTGATSTYAMTVLASAPEAFYRLADGDRGAMADSSGHGATGAYSPAAATLGQSGPLPNDAATATADSGNGPLAVGHPSTPLFAGARTLEGWINTTSVGQEFLASYGTTTTAQGFSVATEPSQVLVSGFNDDLAFTAPAPLNDGSWHFIVVTSTGTTATAYVDGLSLGTRHFPVALDTLPAPGGLSIGSGTGGCCGTFSGDLADVALFPTALPPATVTAQFTASGLGRPPAPTTPSATAGANQATVSWTAPSGASPVVTGYLITASTGAALSVPSTVTSATVTGLAGGTATTFTIAAINEYGVGAVATTASVTPTGATSTYASTTLADGPSVFYRLADTDPGAMADSSGHGATGSYSTAAATLGQGGPLPTDPATSTSDNGNGPLATARPGLPLDNRARTLEAWFDTTAGNEEQIAGYGLLSTAQGFSVAIEPNDVIISGSNDDLTFATTSAINNNSWHFLVVTTNGTTATVYLDGTALGTQTFATELDTLPALQGFELGEGAQGCCGAYTGSLADIAVFGSVLTAAEVTSQYNSSGFAKRTGRPVTGGRS